MSRSKMGENCIHLLKLQQSKIANIVDQAINQDDVQHMERNAQSATR